MESSLQKKKKKKGLFVRSFVCLFCFVFFFKKKNIPKYIQGPAKEEKKK
jgi:hypothetical protein